MENWKIKVPNGKIVVQVGPGIKGHTLVSAVPLQLCPVLIFFKYDVFHRFFKVGYTLSDKEVSFHF
jgi:hypothetical protein